MTLVRWSPCGALLPCQPLSWERVVCRPARPPDRPGDWWGWHRGKMHTPYEFGKWDAIIYYLLYCTPAIVPQQV